MNLFELSAKIGLDDSDYKKGISSSKLSFGKLVSTVGNGVKTIAKASGAALAAGTAVVTGLTKAALDEFAELEQVAGGAELMFGSAYETVANNAKEAYATVQMSQAEYLKQVNGFATGLKTALGGNEQAAADLAHKIIQAEADIIAATGNTAENVQNAFSGIMRSNFTMLDNLQIGITPTKEGFQEVIDKVNEWNAANGKATSYQMDNLADMQSALVDYIEMIGYSGYAQMEASKTISGSIASTKAAWKDLLAGLASGDQDIEKLTDNLVNSAISVAENIGPRIVTILPRIGQGLDKLTRKLVPVIGDFVKKNGPPLLKSATNLIGELTDQIPNLLEFAFDSLPDLAKAALSIISKLGKALLKLAPTLTKKVTNLFKEIDWKKAGEETYNGFKDIDWSEIFTNVFELIGTAIGSVGSFLWGIFSQGLQDLEDYFQRWITNGAKEGKSVGQSIMDAIASGIGDISQWVYDNIIAPLVAGMTGKNLEEVKAAGDGLGETIKNSVSGGLFHKTDFTSASGENVTVYAPQTPVDINAAFLEWIFDVFGINDALPDWMKRTPVDGSHASGLDYVPFDGYIAKLHEGERVLTRREASQYRDGNRGGNIFNITVNGAKYSDEQSLAEAIAEIINFEMEKEAEAFA